MLVAFSLLVGCVYEEDIEKEILDDCINVHKKILSVFLFSEELFVGPTYYGCSVKTAGDIFRHVTVRKKTAKVCQQQYSHKL